MPLGPQCAAGQIHPAGCRTVVPAKGRDHSKGVLFFTEYPWKILARASHWQREVPFLLTSDNCPDDLLKLTTFGPPAPLLVRWDGACNGQTDHCASVSTLRGRDCDFQSRLSGAAAASKLLVSASRRYSTFTMTSPQAQAKTDLELGISGATTTTQGDEHHHRERPTVRFSRGAINLNFICLVIAKRKRLTRAALCDDDNTPGDIPLSSIVNDESTLISLSRLVLRLDCNCNVRNRPAKPKPNSATARKRETGRGGGGGMPIHSCRCQTVISLSPGGGGSRCLTYIAYHARSAPEEYIPPQQARRVSVRPAFFIMPREVGSRWWSQMSRR